VIKIEYKFTTIRIGFDTREKLLTLKHYRRETHVDVITRLINFYEDNNKEE
jgi:predicted CopG family antitoxin